MTTMAGNRKQMPSISSVDFYGRQSLSNYLSNMSTDETTAQRLPSNRSRRSLKANDYDCDLIDEYDLIEQRFNEKDVRTDQRVVGINAKHSPRYSNVETVHNLSDTSKALSHNDSVCHRMADLAINLPQSIDKHNDSRPVIVDYPKCVVFGTYECNPETIELNSDSVSLTCVAPNSELKLTYLVVIAFSEITHLYYCHDISSIFIKINTALGLTIQSCLDLGRYSLNDFKFDTNSSDLREHFITAILSNNYETKFIESLIQMAIHINPNIKLNEYALINQRLVSKLPQMREITPKKNFETDLNKLIANNLRQMPTLKKFDESDKTNMNHQKLTTPKFVTPVKSVFQLSRSLSSTPVIQLDDDPNNDEQSDNEFNQTILTYPPNDENAIHLSLSDMSCLNKGEFINDNIINYYLRRLYSRGDDYLKQSIHIFDTLFFVQLKEKPQHKENYTFAMKYNKKLKKWTKNVDIFSKNYLIMPILENSHWILAIICISLDNKRPSIIFMDSLNIAHLNPKISDNIRNYLSCEWKDQQGSVVSFKSRDFMKDYFPRVPQQTNDSDCGLFLLHYVELFLLNPSYIINNINKNLEKIWFEADEAKYKRHLIRTFIMSSVSTEIADKLALIKYDNELDDEIVGALDSDPMDSDYTPPKIAVSLNSGQKPVTRSTSKSNLQIN